MKQLSQTLHARGSARLRLCVLTHSALTFLAGVLFVTLVTGIGAQQPVREEAPVHFCAIDIFVDAGSTPLAAYQLEFADSNQLAKIVGIEGGEHAAFRQPPFYDPKAMQHERVIIASFSTAAAASLPAGKTRVATIHVQIAGIGLPLYKLKLATAGDSQGNKIPARASFEERKTP
jgi:hypothetical protein